MTKKSEPREELGYAPLSTIGQILKDRETAPKGRQPNFTAEFKVSFGCTPEEAHDLRAAAEKR